MSAQASGRRLSGCAREQAGLSLIELMIALLIGTILLGGVMQIFLASRQASRLSEGMARTQENARFASDYLQRDIRMVGHYGCVNDQSRLQTPGGLTSHFAVSGFDPLNYAVSVEGYEASGTGPGNTVTLGSETGGWTPGLPAAISALSPRAGSDVLVLRYLYQEGAPVSTIATSGSATTFTVPAARWPAFTGDGVAAPVLFGVADCSYTDIFRATATNSTAGTVTAGVNIDRYTPLPSGQTMLYRAESLVYYVGTGAGGGPSLFRARYDGATNRYIPDELVEGVENLQFLYGLDRVADLTNNPPSGYIDVVATASGVGAAEPQWRRVGSIQVGLLMRSPDRAGATAPTAANRKQLLGVTFNTPATPDQMFRDTFELTVAARNRLYGN